MIILSTELIVYKPKINIGKIVLKIFLGILISALIFIIAAFIGALVFLKLKWNKTEYVNLKTTVVSFSVNDKIK